MRTWPIPAGLAASLALLTGSASLAAAVSQPATPPVSAMTAAGHAPLSVTEVTLITGDRVRVTTGPGGVPSAQVEARYTRNGVSYDERTIPGPGHRQDLLVLPSDAAPLVASGELDENLFDVSELARDGYGDARASALPLIVTYQNQTAPRSLPLAPRMATVTRDLPSVNGEAVSEPVAGAARFWASLTEPAPAGNGALTLTPQVAKVWLDRKAQATVGTGMAWRAARAAAAQAAGMPRAAARRPARSAAPAYDGSGVLVADLDTGYDMANPDLKGVVAGSEDFTGSPDGVQDGNGHGTWTASIIAGSGAASGGTYSGVAPGARLLVGKVLGDGGVGTESQVIAGLQWAAAQHARIVNLSLGFSDPWICEDGTDPVSQAVDWLSTADGTLFVVAAGNDGQLGSGTVETPGVADDALTAGAVDSSGNLAFFSSTGPRCGDDAVKPDVTAPGVGIVGARAAGTSLGRDDGIDGDGPVDANYTRASGTSASAPYVSGAAAMLAQEHPDWDGSQLKTALMDSATPSGGTSVYGQGDGQVDVARAVAQTASATASQSKLLSWPHTAPSAMAVSYSNSSAAPLTLSLALSMTGPDGSPAAAGMFTTSTPQVTVPAGGIAHVTVTVEPAAGPDGRYGGWLTAVGPGTVLHTAIGVENQPQLETITFRGIDRNGQAVTGADLAVSTGVINLSTGQATQATIPGAGGAVTAAVPPGQYDLSNEIQTAATDTSQASATLLDHPDVNVDRDLTVTFDVQRGVPVSATADHPTDDTGVVAAVAETVAGTPVSFGVASFFNESLIYAAPTSQVTGRSYEFLAQVQLDNGSPDPSQPGRATLTYSLEFPRAGRIPGQLSFRVHDSALAMVRETFRQQGKPMTFVDEPHYTENPAEAPFGPSSGSEFFVPPSGTVTEYMSPGRWQTFGYTFYGSAFNPAWAEEGPVVRYQAGHSYHDIWGSAALGVASDATRLGDVITPGVLPDSASAPGHLNADILTSGISGTVSLRRGGTVIGTGPVAGQLQFTVPAASSRYTLSVSMRRDVPWSTLGTTAKATWTFSSGHVAGASAATLPLWDVRISGGFSSLDRAPAGRAFQLTVAPDLPAGAPRAGITSIAVRASFDDGSTWQPLVLRSDGAGRWTTTITPPPGSAFVSLSASLTDAAGNSTQQTVIRTYQL